MLRPDQRELRALQDLRHSDAFSYFVRAYAEAREQLVTQREADVVRVLQGQAQAYRHLLAVIDPEGFSTDGKRGMGRGTVYTE